MRARRVTLALTLLLCSGGGLMCEPSADLGTDHVVITTPDDPQDSSVGGIIESGGNSNAEDEDDPRIITSSDGDGLGGQTVAPDPMVEPDCFVTHLSEVHEEPISVCCNMTPMGGSWREEAFDHIQAARRDAELPEFKRDPGLDHAAIAWAMHWSLHWDPEEKKGYPGRAYAPNNVAEECGTTANLLMATDAQDEPILADGFIDPSFPAEYWKNDGNLSERFLDADFTRLGIGIFDGLLVGVLGKAE